MNTPKEKAKELVQKFRIHQPVWEVEGDSKKCALIAVDEIMKQCFDYRDIDLQASYDYWLEVKQEIEKL